MPSEPQGSQSGFSPIFVVLAALFSVCLIVSNLLEIKTIDLGPLTLTAGVVVFPISYILSDCIVEVYGFGRARLVIWMGFALALLVSVLLRLGILLPGGANWEAQEAMERIYGSVPRIMVASFGAFVCGSMVNAYVMSRMKVRQRGRHFSVRAIVSTLWGEGVDSCVFFPVAFAGVLPWGVIVSMILTQALVKTLYEVMALPVTLRVVRRLKRAERSDVFDTDADYSWWRFSGASRHGDPKIS